MWGEATSDAAGASLPVGGTQIGLWGAQLTPYLLFTNELHTEEAGMHVQIRVKNREFVGKQKHEMSRVLACGLCFILFDL